MGGVIYVMLSLQFDEYVHELLRILALLVLMYGFHRFYQDQNVNEVRFIHGPLVVQELHPVVLSAMHMLYDQLDLLRYHLQ